MKLSSSNVEVIGFVPDLFNLMTSEVDLCIAPIWSGKGIITKVLDMMACAQPVITTQFVARAIVGIEDGRNALVATTREDFVQRTLQAIGSLEEEATLGRNARELVASRYDWRLYEAKLVAVLMTVWRRANDDS